jgi:hypothetical protein
MTRKQAKAILACQKAVMKALETCRGRLKGSEEGLHFDAYWGSRVTLIMQGSGYGSAPIKRAEETLE